jgi:pimeloyl-ACP methyl ester carboxylesterase
MVEKVRTMNIDSGTVASNGLEFFYDVRGPEQGEPVLFIMGLSAQMVFWPEPLLNDLANRGYRVYRFDNRDVGLSSRLRLPLHHKPMDLMGRFFTGRSIQSGYTLDDMVDDTIGIMDALGLVKVHLVGASMGGMISQLLSARHPERVLSLNTIMSSTNPRLSAPPKPAALKTLVGPRKRIETLEEYIEHGRGVMANLGGTLEQGDELVETMFRESWERGLYPRGVLQQFTAIMATGSFAHRLKHVRAPVAVIHGSHDPLIRLANGKTSVRAMRAAKPKLHVIKGMGHDLPEAALEQVADIIYNNAQKASLVS